MLWIMGRSEDSLGYVTSVLRQLLRMLHCLPTTKNGSTPSSECFTQMTVLGSRQTFSTYAITDAIVLKVG